MEDEKILALYSARDEQAIAETALKYGKMLKAIAYNILKSQPDCEECENDTYQIAWNKIPPANPPHLAGFLGRIARNLAFDKYAYKTAAKRHTDWEIEISELENCLGTPSAESEYEQKQIAEALSSFLRSIEQENRVIFIRRYWYADSIAQISRLLGYSESKIKTRLMRTRRKLKKYLEGQGVKI